MTKGELRKQRMLDGLRRDEAALESRITAQEQQLAYVESVGQEEDWSDAVLDTVVNHERYLLWRVRSERRGLMARRAWLGFVIMLTPVLIPLSNACDNWMNSPDPHRR